VNAHPVTRVGSTDCPRPGSDFRRNAARCRGLSARTPVARCLDRMVMGGELQGGAMVESRCSSIPGPEPKPATRRCSSRRRECLRQPRAALPTVSARAAAASNRRTHLEQADTRGRTTNQWAAEVGIQIDSSAIPSDKPEGGAVAADLPAAAAVGAGETAVSTAATSCAMLPASAPSVGIRRCPVPSSLVVVWLACMWGSLSMPGENWASVAD
jgi:hypothetical protein